MSNTALDELLVDEPPATQDEIVRINTEARPLALQIAMLIPLLAALTGLTISFRMTRLPQAPPTAPVEAAVWG